MTNTPTPETSKVVSAEEILFNTDLDMAIELAEHVPTILKAMQEYAEAYHHAQQQQVGEDVEQAAEKFFDDLDRDVYDDTATQDVLFVDGAKFGAHWQSSQSVDKGEVNKRGFIDEVGLTGRDLELARAHNKLTRINNGTIYEVDTPTQQAADGLEERAKAKYREYHTTAVTAKRESYIAGATEERALITPILNELLIHLKATNPSEEQKERAIKAVEGLIR